VDIPALSIAMHQAQLQQVVSALMLKLSMDTAQDNAAVITEMMADAAKMMELSVAPHLGSNLDVVV
jgi:hypothetical protein